MICRANKTTVRKEMILYTFDQELKGKPTGCLARGQSIDDDLRQSEHNSTAESEGLNKLLALGPKNDRPNGLTRTKKKGDQFPITPSPGSSH